jgi:hypothetical protein
MATAVAAVNILAEFQLLPAFPSGDIVGLGGPCSNPVQVLRAELQPEFSVQARQAGEALFAVQTCWQLSLPQATVSPKQDAQSLERPVISDAKQLVTPSALPILLIAHTLIFSVKA